MLLLLVFLQELCDIVGTQFGEYWPEVKNIREGGASCSLVDGDRNFVQTLVFNAKMEEAESCKKFY